MITSALLYIIYGFVYVVTSPLRLLPNASLPADLTAAITAINGYITALNPVLPISTILTVVGFVLSIEAFIFTYKVIMWVLKRFPTQS